MGWGKPLTEDLSLHVLIRVVVFDGNWDTPLEVPSDRAWMQTALEPRVDESAFTVDYGIGRPPSLPPRLLDPLFRLRLDLV